MTQEVERAVDIAAIVDVKLNSSFAQFADPDVIHLTGIPENSTMQFKKIMRDYTIGDDDFGDLHLFIRYDFGVRIMVQEDVIDGDGNIEQKELATIEACFLARYLMQGAEPDQKTIENFATSVGMFNVWPYWREYASDVSRRMGLDGIVIPLFKLRFNNNKQKNNPIAKKRLAKSTKKTIVKPAK
ncbi:MAG: hypothetical protein HQL69_19935 [Magnetococcales bacterium]|nr:hypothetical protein [Magnetococcales bacterium]